MDAVESFTLPNTVAPDETIDISIDLTAPAIPGTYRGNWSFEDKTGKQFGLGASANGQIWVQVKVLPAPLISATASLVPQSTQTSGPTSTSESTTEIPTNTPQTETPTYDFVSEICSAQWLSNNVQQPCPSSNGTAQNNIKLVSLPVLEDGTTLKNPAIMISPSAANASVQGIYPEYEVKTGDHFRAIASCEANSTSCSALFRVSYQDSSNAIVDLWAVGEFYDQKYTQIDIDISPLTGQKVKFILDVAPLNTDPGNHVFWASPGVYNAALPTTTPTITPIATQAATDTPVPTATHLAATPTPIPQPQARPASVAEQIVKFFADMFKSIFGG